MQVLQTAWTSANSTLHPVLQLPAGRVVQFDGLCLLHGKLHIIVCKGACKQGDSIVGLTFVLDPGCQTGEC